MVWTGTASALQLTLVLKRTMGDDSHSYIIVKLACCAPLLLNTLTIGMRTTVYHLSQSLTSESLDSAKVLHPTPGRNGKLDANFLRISGSPNNSVQSNSSTLLLKMFDPIFEHGTVQRLFSAATAATGCSLSVALAPKPLYTLTTLGAWFFLPSV